MSRYKTDKKYKHSDGKEYSIFYGYDRMVFPPGYFIQIQGINERGDKVYLENEGFLSGVSKLKIFKVIEKYKIKDFFPKNHINKLALDLPF